MESSIIGCALISKSENVHLKRADQGQELRTGWCQRATDASPPHPEHSEPATSQEPGVAGAQIAAVAAVVAREASVAPRAGAAEVEGANRDHSGQAGVVERLGADEASSRSIARPDGRVGTG